MIGDGINRTENIKNFIRNSFVNKLIEGGQLYELEKTFIVANCGELRGVSKKEFKSFSND